MAPQLWLLRHGEAVPHESKPDDERELTPRGRRQSEVAGRALAKLGLAFAACYTSPKVRAVETAQLACGALSLEPEVAPSLAGLFDRDAALELLLAHGPDDRVLAVGHEPTFSQVVYDLTGGRIDFKKGGVAGMRIERASGELLVLLRPRELEAIASGTEQESRSAGR
jgi:phosphohistidine phosphatase